MAIVAPHVWKDLIGAYFFTGEKIARPRRPTRRASRTNLHGFVDIIVPNEKGDT